MHASEQAALPRDLAQARSQFEAWRCRRQGRGRIPDRLWALAVGLVNRHGVSRTAAVLRLDYYTLKARAEATSSTPPSNGSPFVELPSPAVPGKHGLVELDNGAGATMRVQLAGYDAADVEALARSFWNAGRCYRSHRK
jgi:hypothetical protein